MPVIQTGSQMPIAVNSGSWPTGDIANTFGAVAHARVSDERSDTTFNNYIAAGFKVCRLFAGPYNGGGVNGIAGTQAAADSWAAARLSWYQAHTNPTETPFIEPLNEPAGGWFWNANKDSNVASNQTNADAFARILKATWTAFHGAYGSNSPLIFAAWDGGQAGGSQWGNRWKNSTAVAGGGIAYCDAVTVHPYGGSSGQYGGANGNRTSVTNAHNDSGKPVAITELGWPTCGATSDSQSWSESAQATNLSNFIDYARASGILCYVSFYNDVDESSTRCYGNVRHLNGSNKPARAVLVSKARPSGSVVTPAVALTAPTAGTKTGTITWSATASSTAGIQKVELLVDGTSVQTDTTSTYGGTFDTTTLANGAHTLSARATGNDGGTATTAGVAITVSNAGAPSSITISADPSSTDKIIFNVPAGTVKIHVYQADQLAVPAPAGHFQYNDIDVPAGPWHATRLDVTGAAVWVDAQALDASNNPIGGFASDASGTRIQRTPVVAPPASITIAADPSSTDKILFTPPPGAVSIKVYMSDQLAYPAPAGHYEYLTIAVPAGAWHVTRLDTTNATVWVDAIALDGAGAEMGAYASDASGTRVQRDPVVVPPLPPNGGDLRTLRTLTNGQLFTGTQVVLDDLDASGRRALVWRKDGVSIFRLRMTDQQWRDLVTLVGA